MTTTVPNQGATTPEALLDAGAVLPPGTLPGAGRPDSAADVLGTIIAQWPAAPR